MNRQEAAVAAARDLAAGHGVTYRRERVPVDGGELTVGVWGEGGPLVVAAHGITSSHLAWGLVGAELGRDHRFVAADLRGRGASRDLPGPYGMAAHAADLAACVAAAGGGPAILVGHSMGGFVVAAAVHRYPGLAERAVLVDGGAPLPAPARVPAEAGDEEIGQAVAATVGPAYARLSMEFDSPRAYRDLWRAHPALPGWSGALSAYVDYDLVSDGGPPYRSACRLEAALRDARDLYALGDVRPRPLPVPAVFLRAQGGMFGDADAPLYPAGQPSHWLPGVIEREVPGVNHYTIILGDAGVAAVADAVRTGH
jgi:lipase